MIWKEDDSSVVKHPDESAVRAALAKLDADGKKVGALGAVLWCR
jgi:hypothetical protein